MFLETKGFNARFRMGHMDQDQGSPSFPSIMTQHPILTDPWSRVAVRSGRVESPQKSPSLGRSGLAKNADPHSKMLSQCPAKGGP